MLSKCANPQCRAAFLYLHQGKLFRIETEACSHRQQILAQENPLGGSNTFGSVMIVLRK